MKPVKTEIGMVLYCERMRHSWVVAGGHSIHHPAGQISVSSVLYELKNQVSPWMYNMDLT
jgi:hypothetical protein